VHNPLDKWHDVNAAAAYTAAAYASVTPDRAPSSHMIFTCKILSTSGVKQGDSRQCRLSHDFYVQNPLDKRSQARRLSSMQALTWFLRAKSSRQAESSKATLVNAGSHMIFTCKILSTSGVKQDDSRQCSSSLCINANQCSSPFKNDMTCNCICICKAAAACASKLIF
jgi:hypothetical protein